MKKRDIEGVGLETAKQGEDEDVMDVEPQTPAQPPSKATANHANEYSPDKPTPTSTDRKEAEDAPHTR